MIAEITGKLRMMKKYILQWLILPLLLSSCGTLPPPPTATSAPTLATLPPTPSPAPSQTPSPTVLPSPTAIPQFPQFPLDGYVMVFSKDENLYFQDGNNQPVQLTHGEETYFIALSDDSQKIVLSNKENREIYSINTDGSERKTLLKRGLDGNYLYPTLVPDRHELLFNTYHQCETRDEKTLCAVGLSQVNIDTGKTKQVIAPSEIGDVNYSGNFDVSPNGKMISVASPGHIDIYTVGGQIIRRDVLPYTPSTPDALFPVQFWLSDSSGLTVALPTATNDTAFGPFPAYTIWRYEIDGNRTISLVIDPPPMLYKSKISPDGNWILYGGFGRDAGGFDPWSYLVNLVNGEKRPC
jgi:Tol biopolymer transport system component